MKRVRPARGEIGLLVGGVGRGEFIEPMISQSGICAQSGKSGPMFHDNDGSSEDLYSRKHLEQPN